jgi:hypothetical protein
MIDKEDILKAQKSWGEAIIKIGSLKEDRKACEEETLKSIDSLYAFGSHKVLFKPTKASSIPFRLNKEGAKSYFIGGDKNFPEDSGFALRPWTNIRFENASVVIEDKKAYAMGHYYFKNGQNHIEKVEYTFGYIEDQNGEIKIDLHHSSVPFSP